MGHDQVAGKFQDVTGRAEAAVGSVAGDHETELSGRAREAGGVAQNLYGKAQDALGDALGDASTSADRAINSAREALESGTSALTKEVNARPLIALLVAALVGYVVASLMHGSSSGRR